MNPVTLQIALAVRVVRWWLLVVAATIAVGLLTATSKTRPLDTAELVIGLRLAALGLCPGAALLVDDDAANTVEASPVSLLRRRAVRVAFAVAAVAATSAFVLA